MEPADDILVDKVAARILARMRGIEIDVSPRSVTVVFSGAASGFAAGREAVSRLAQSSHEMTVMLTPSAKHIFGESTIRDLGAKTIVELEPWIDVSDSIRRADLVLVPTLTMNLVARLALGVMDAAATTLVLGALLAGKKVLAIRDGAEPSGKRGEALGAVPGGSPVLWKLLEDRLATVESYGMELVGKDGFLFRMEQLLIAPRGRRAQAGAAQPQSAPAAAASIAGAIVTAAEIQSLRPGANLALAPGQRLTPEASDLAARLGLRLRAA